MAHLGATLVTPPAPFPSWRAAVGAMAMPEGGLKVDREQKETSPAEPPAAPAAGSAHPGPRKHPAEPTPAILVIRRRAWAQAALSQSRSQCRTSATYCSS